MIFVIFSKGVGLGIELIRITKSIVKLLIPPGSYLQTLKIPSCGFIIIAK